MAKFEASARSVDMLGRQQIAGIPTAISEIFKNSYDAYASGVRGDYFPDRHILMIRDDGVGMSHEDFLNRWMTIGTSSKIRGSALAPISPPPGIAERRQMGEKGIGRLAIATLGPQLLVVTRATDLETSRPGTLVVALVQWSMFEAPSLTLSDVVVPLRLVNDPNQVDGSLLNSMAAELREQLTLHQESGRVAPDHAERIRRELSHLDFDPRVFMSLSGPSPARSTGSAFLVCPVSDDVDAAMEVRDVQPDRYSVSEFQRFLLGFINTITPDAQTPDFDTEFIRHTDTGFEDIIDPSTYFWEASDFRLTDHTVEGDVDEYGVFRGMLSIYGKEPVEIVETWPGARGSQTACGPFRIKFGYIQGQSSESRLAPEDFSIMTSRLDKIGGLYIYRDGIRVLPYGNSDNDYLEIEKRRSLNAGRYYFSYRRMFGAISLDSGRNPQLQEKAGREGFRENRAYREFRDILKNLFIQMAANYFSEGESAEPWRSERERLKATSVVRLERERAERRARDRFAQALQAQIDYVESGRFASDADDLVTEVRAAIESTGHTDSGGTEERALDRLTKLRESVALRRPAGLPLTAAQEQDWQSFIRIQPLIESTIAGTSKRLDRAFATFVSDGGERLAEARLERVRELAEEKRSDAVSAVEQIQSGAVDLAKGLQESARREVADFDARLAELLEPKGPVTLSRELELTREIAELANLHSEALGRLLRQVELALDAGEVEHELLGAKEEVLDLQDQIDRNLELLQLGQAVQVVSHEFEASIRSVRLGLQKLAPWARSTPRLKPVVRDLRASFAHLDGYLRLFTPLQRRLYRERVELSGEEIESFVRGVFSERLVRHEVELRVTNNFRAWRLEGYPSTFYPVFVNLVDNAIYWVASDVNPARRITLDADPAALYVRDNGPGIRVRDRELIFERGFGRRRGGRGLGLALARELLSRDGWDLELVAADGPGAVFRISQFEEPEARP